jgi:hypothetical protein
LTALHWLVLTSAAASAGVYAGGIALLAFKRWNAEPATFPALISAVALFAFARAFAHGAAFSALAAAFLVLAARQTLRARASVVQILALVPICAMLLIAIGPFFSAYGQTVIQRMLTALLCMPAPIAIAASLRNLHLVRQAAFHRVR